MVEGKKKRGTRVEVWHGEALRTNGGLTKEDLFQKKNGHVVSKRASEASKKKMNHSGLGHGHLAHHKHPQHSEHAEHEAVAKRTRQKTKK